jgi:hypothetical protein
MPIRLATERPPQSENQRGAMPFYGTRAAEVAVTYAVCLEAILAPFPTILSIEINDWLDGRPARALIRCAALPIVRSI